MPHSGGETGELTATVILMYSMFNLMMPIHLLAFALLALFLAKRRSAPPLGAAHLAQTLSASIWAGALLIAANGLILLLGGYESAATWVILILYFTVCHSVLVLLGILGLAKAMAGQCWRFPLVGRPLPAGCPKG